MTKSPIDLDTGSYTNAPSAACFAIEKEPVMLRAVRALVGARVKSPLSLRFLIEKEGKLENSTTEVISPLRAIRVVCGSMLTNIPMLMPKGSVKTGRLMLHLNVALRPLMSPCLEIVIVADEP